MMSDKPAENPQRAKKSRRVSWNPAGDRIDPGFVDAPVETSEEDWADRTLSNDEQLKRDKPPHWG